jgi:molybdate/tungstate transport system substrate-binding protein
LFFRLAEENPLPGFLFVGVKPVMNKPKNIFNILMFFILMGNTLVSCKPKEKTPLVVFAAGSLIGPFAALEKSFEAKYPNIDVVSEYHGSIQVIRHTTDLHQSTDVIATADHALIPMLMYTVNDPDTGIPYANWYLRFATNNLGLAYTATSKYSGEITTDNWMEIISRPDVKIGIADPRFDASGYRALMAIKLAEKLYNKGYLFSDMFAGQFRIPLKMDEGGGKAIIRVPEVLEMKDGGHVVIRGASVQLLALLESGDLDYAFEYESVIKQHKLNLLSLPAELNLGNADLNQEYGNVSVKLDFQRFATVKPEFIGEQIGYGITIPSDARHPKEAELFITYLLGPDGRQLMEDYYHPLFEKIDANGYDYLPESLKQVSVPAQ